MNVSDKVAVPMSTNVAAVPAKEQKQGEASATAKTTSADTVSISPEARAMFDSQLMTDNPGDWPTPPVKTVT